MFDALAGRLTAAARLLKQMFTEPHKLAEHVAAIKKVEHEADVITHDIIARIDTSFVTPIDREDIHMLASRLDNVIDLVDGTARRAAMFRLTEVREPAKQLADVLVAATDALQQAVADIKKSKQVSELTRQVKLREEEADTIYHEAVGGLFRGTPDPLDVIKWKEMYDTLEEALDECEDVANVVESISLKHA
ncbi:MAG: DUF47 family protein [Gemmatimonadota bacterium]|nr:DUF47 family protein [Gemmatimonadota bacterium]